MRTSGARKPGVPARGATWGLLEETRTSLVVCLFVVVVV